MCIVLVTPNPEGEKIWLNQDYLRALLRSGVLAYVLPVTEEEAVLDAYLAKAGGLLLSGGGDVGPALYGAARSPLCGPGDWKRDRMEIYLCRKALERDLPVMGICRGVQVMNVALQGTLLQHVEGHSRMDLPRDAVHDVLLQAGTRLQAIFGREKLGVNSRHHQAVSTLGRGLRASAVAPDGVVEAVELPGASFFVGVQWHPESMYEAYDDMKKLFAAFAAAVKGIK